MENRGDLRSILPFLPLKLESSSLVWPNQVIEALKSISKGPTHSQVDSGEVLSLAISDLRSSLSLSSHNFAGFSIGDGFFLFFDELLSRAEAAKFFAETIPMMANLLLRLPALLESHYQYADIIFIGSETGLRLLEPQEPGVVFLSQELVAALLSCSFFCLFPTDERSAKHLPKINFDGLFGSLYTSYSENQEHKIKCIIHYFERIYSCMPSGYVSFERKVLPLGDCPPFVSYPTADFWAYSEVALSQFEVSASGMIEDQPKLALEVDFANKFLGGGALHRGCVQEEIRFMINPELIAGMLFLPSMSDNEAIEIVGAEQFSNYAGYAATFRYSSDHVDKKDIDSMGRRKTRIVAIDALCHPGSKQYRLDYLLREVNKAFCGFLDQPKCQQDAMIWQGSDVQPGNVGRITTNISEIQSILIGDNEISPETNQARDHLKNEPHERDDKSLEHCTDIGVATGNWGCGAFGGDPEIKAMIQWLAASQALRPFILYYTFEVEQLRNLEQVCQWILAHNWTVRDLWNMLVDYCTRRIKRETNLGFLSWLLPSLHSGNNITL